MRTVWMMFVASAVLALAPAAPASAADVCSGYTGPARIGSLGGPNAFGKGVSTREELSRRLTEDTALRAELRALLAGKGLGHLNDKVLAAIDSGKGVSERNLERGEVFEWMAWRKKGMPTVTGPMCFAAKKTYSAFIVEVVDEEVMEGEEPTCKLSASSTCTELTVDAAGSSAGVKVTMSGPGGERTVVSGGSAMSWSGEVEPGTYTFTARGKGTPGKVTRTKHTFIIPKVCINIAYAGKSEPMEITIEAATCEASETETVEECGPSCELTVSPSTAAPRQPVTISASGEYDDLTVEVTKDGVAAKLRDGDGRKIDQVGSLPATLTFRKQGRYEITGTARRGDHPPATCSATVDISKSVGGAGCGWTARVFGLYGDPKSDEAFTSRFLSDGRNERTHLSLSDGSGFGGGLEYCFNDRVGLEGSILLAEFDSRFMFDIDNDWDMDSDDVEFNAFTLGPNFHLTPNSAVDLYIGPFIGFAELDDGEYQVLGQRIERDFGDDIALGAVLGLDIPFGDRDWGLNLSARFMDFSVDVTGAGVPDREIDVDPFLIGVGFHFDF